MTSKVFYIDKFYGPLFSIKTTHSWKKKKRKRKAKVWECSFTLSKENVENNPTSISELRDRIILN